MNEPPRIVHVIGRLDGYGGSRLLRALAVHQARAGGRVAVAALAREEFVAAELRATGVEVQSLGGRWRFDPIAAGRLRRLLHSTKADVVHAWDDDAVAYTRMTATGAPLVAAWVDDGAMPTWQQAMAPYVYDALPAGVRQPVAPRFSRAEACAELGLPTGAPWIAIAGPLVRRKQLDESIWCFELVRVLHPEARLVIFGEGPDRARLERYALLVSEPGCVLFPGFRRNLEDLLPHADVYWQLDAAVATTFALLEAMAAGLPAVASDVPALAAVVQPGVTGVLAPLAHRAAVARATDQLLSDPVLRRRLGAAAAETVEKRWSLEAALSACDTLYRRFVSNTNSG
jgi:hypothetical protein